MGRHILLVLVLTVALIYPGRAANPQQEIDAFNREFRDATLRMDNPAAVALWEDDGVTLLPGLAPIEGKKTIAKWLDDVVARMPGYRVTAQENSFQDLQVSGEWASEWGITHQVVQPPGGKAPIDTWGKVLLVLHKGHDGRWRIREEMWTAGPKP